MWYTTRHRILQGTGKLALTVSEVLDRDAQSAQMAEANAGTFRLLRDPVGS